MARTKSNRRVSIENDTRIYLEDQVLAALPGASRVRIDLSRQEEGEQFWTLLVVVWYPGQQLTYKAVRVCYDGDLVSSVEEQPESAVEELVTSLHAHEE